MTSSGKIKGVIGLELGIIMPFYDFKSINQT